MTDEGQVRGAQLTRESDRPLNGPIDNWNVPLILAMTLVFATAGASLWTKSRYDDSAAKEQPPARESDEHVGERPAIRAICPNHQAEYVDVMRGQAGWQRRDAHTGRLLTQDRLSKG